MSNIEKIANALKDLYFEGGTETPDYEMGIGSDLKEFGTIELDKLDQYNEILKQSKIKIEIDPEDEDYFIVSPV